MRLTVLMGGTNLERDTSLVSGWQVAQALREAGHEVAAVDTAKPVAVAKGAAFADLGGAVEPPPIGVLPPSAAELSRLRRRQHHQLLAPQVLDLCEAADCVFMALFGDEGEGGRAQGLLDHAGVTYTGPDPLGCAVSFDKDMAKRLIGSTEVPTAEWTTVPQGEPLGEHALDLLPAVVKPVGGGSSIGVSVARNAGELRHAVATAHATHQDALVERRLTGREFTVGVLEGQALPAVELVTGRDVVDYESKYQQGRTTKHCPAPLNDPEAARLGAFAVAAHAQLKLGPQTCSRMDFRMDGEGEFHFLECNPLPGMTPSSFLPVAARAAGLDLPSLCDRVVRLATDAPARPRPAAGLEPSRP